LYFIAIQEVQCAKRVVSRWEVRLSLTRMPPGAGTMDDGLQSQGNPVNSDKIAIKCKTERPTNNPMTRQRRQ
jgi:hypothetical protein